MAEDLRHSIGEAPPALESGDRVEVLRDDETPPIDPHDDLPEIEVAAPKAAGFRAWKGMLVGIGVAAIVITVGLLSGVVKHNDGPAWSVWHPESSGDSGALEIASHVSADYRRDDGSQLVTVSGGAAKIQDLPVHLAVRVGSDVRVITGDTTLYSMCGGGPRCSISTGTPSVERQLLLRREALEIALYTFRYLKSQNVVVLLPPRPPVKNPRTGKITNFPNYGLVFRRGELQPLLDRPLVASLSPEVPTISDVATSPGMAAIDSLTEGDEFKVTITQGPDLSAFLILDLPTTSSTLSQPVPTAPPTSTGGSGTSEQPTKKKGK